MPNWIDEYQAWEREWKGEQLVNALAHYVYPRFLLGDLTARQHAREIVNRMLTYFHL